MPATWRPGKLTRMPLAADDHELVHRGEDRDDEAEDGEYDLPRDGVQHGADI
jgi:hypothetical protein